MNKKDSKTNGGARKMKQRKVRKTKLKLYLEDNGIDANLLADKVKKKFKKTKKWTFDTINGNSIMDIHARIIFAFCLGLKLNEI